MLVNGFCGLTTTLEPPAETVSVAFTVGNCPLLSRNVKVFALVTVMNLTPLSSSRGTPPIDFVILLLTPTTDPVPVTPLKVIETAPELIALLLTVFTAPMLITPLTAIERAPVLAASILHIPTAPVPVTPLKVISRAPLVFAIPLISTYAIEAVPLPDPTPVAVKVSPTVLADAPIKVKSVVPIDVIRYSCPTKNDPALVK